MFLFAFIAPPSLSHNLTLIQELLDSSRKQKKNPKAPGGALGAGREEYGI
jgi:hypothetical protein